MRIHTDSHPLAIQSIIGGHLYGNQSLSITGINEINKVQSGDITFVDHPKYYSKALSSSASLIIINQKQDFDHSNKAIIVHEDPFQAFNLLVDNYYKFSPSNELIAESAQIGSGTIIQPNTFIGNNVKIGKNCLIHANVSIYDHVEIGDNVIIHGNTCIGSDAFYFKNRGAYHDKLHSCGNVIIQDDVEIGASCTIDKGVSSDTLIGQGTKIDNQVHIAHGVTIGKHCLFAAKVAIAGKTIVEDHVTLWGGVGVNSKVTIGARAIVLGQSGVTKSIEGGKTYMGTPAQESRAHLKQQIMLRKLPELLKKLKG